MRLAISLMPARRNRELAKFNHTCRAVARLEVIAPALGNWSVLQPLTGTESHPKRGLGPVENLGLGWVTNPVLSAGLRLAKIRATLSAVRNTG